jgi:hypothetical protein
MRPSVNAGLAESAAIHGSISKWKHSAQQFNGSIMFNPVPFLGLKCAIFPQDQYWLVVSTFNPSEQQ